MLQVVDAALGKIIEDSVGSYTYEGKPKVDFKVPTTQNASMDGSLKVNVYLYDFREDLSRRQAGDIYLRRTQAADGKTMLKNEVHRPPRYMRLSYMVTAWGESQQDVHAVLGVLFADLCQRDGFTISMRKWPELEVALMPDEHIDFPDFTLPNKKLMPVYVEMEVGQPPAEEKHSSELWTSFDNVLAPFLNVTLVLPAPTYELLALTKNYVKPGGVHVFRGPWPKPEGQRDATKHQQIAGG